MRNSFLFAATAVSFFSLASEACPDYLNTEMRKLGSHLVSADGEVVAKFRSDVSPDSPKVRATLASVLEP